MDDHTLKKSTLTKSPPTGNQQNQPLTKKDIPKLLITGALAGVANGLFGSGGGLFLVPLFIYWLKIDEKKAFATSVSVIVPLSIISLVIILINGELQLGKFWPVLIGGFFGGIISGLTFNKISATWLKRIFGILIIVGGIRALFLL